MTRILVQRGLQGGSQGSSSASNPSRSSSGSSSARTESQFTPQPLRDEDIGEQFLEQVSVSEVSDSCRISEDMVEKSENLSRDGSYCNQNEIVADDFIKAEKGTQDDDVNSKSLVEEFHCNSAQIEVSSGEASKSNAGSSHPPPPPVPPPKPASTNLNSRRALSGSSNDPKIGPSRRAVAWPIVSARTSSTGSRHTSPRSHGESEGYNSSDEQKPCFVSYDDAERERQFEIDIRRAKGLEVKRMVADGNCLFRAIADQVYGDSELYDLARQLCLDYMERERDHFAQFITEGFTSYCKRKRRDKVYGNNVEIQALAEMYSRPIHIYSYNTEPINIFQGSYDTDSPPIRLSFHQGNHYNSLIDPRRPTIGAGLGFSSLRGANVDKDQVKAAIKAQQDQQIENALLVEGQFYSDLELTEKEIEHMVMEASRAEYLSDNKFGQQLSLRDSSTSNAEPSSSGARPSGSATKLGGREASQSNVLSGSIQIVLSMGFSYLQAIEAYSIFGDDVDSMVCYLLETSNDSRRKGKAAK